MASTQASRLLNLKAEMPIENYAFLEEEVMTLLIEQDERSYAAGVEETRAKYKAVLSAALHDLETTEGLYATDDFEAYGRAQEAGCDQNGAWDIFVDQTFRLVHPSIPLVREALRLLEEKP